MPATLTPYWTSTTGAGPSGIGHRSSAIRATRGKNTLSIDQAIARRRLRGDATLSPVPRAVEGRPDARTAARRLLAQQTRAAAALHDILGAASSPVRDDATALAAICPLPLRLRPRQAAAIAIPLHELATNALKDGRSLPGQGRIEIDWDIRSGEDDGTRGRLRFSGTESGGPTVTPPAGRGFGSRMIERALAAELGGAASLDSGPRGSSAVLKRRSGEGMEAV